MSDLVLWIVFLLFTPRPNYRRSSPYSRQCMHTCRVYCGVDDEAMRKDHVRHIQNCVLEVRARSGIASQVHYSLVRYKVGWKRKNLSFAQNVDFFLGVRSDRFCAW